jgi:hypothetical protein
MLNVLGRLGLAFDSLAHLKAGALAASYGAVLGFLLGLAVAVQLLKADRPWPLVIALVCAAVGALVGASAAGIAKEKTDRDNNQLYPGSHRVEVRDAVWTAAPGVLAFCGLVVAAHYAAQGLLVWPL